MNFKLTPIFALATLFVLHTAQLRAQYYGERVSAKTFEQEDFFFQPSFVNPYGLGGFGRAAPGLIDNPLLDLHISPALLSVDSLGGSYVYLDFRSSRDVQDRDQYYPWFAYAERAVWYPDYYYNTRRELEPTAAAAFLFQPFRRSLPGLALGLTYQGVIQDEPYYTIPYDTYRSNPGYDLAGERALDQNIPIEDVYRGEDAMRQVGHFATLYSSYALTPAFRLGLRAGFALFDRDGSTADQNRWRHFGVGNSNSFWANSEARNQDYDQWDLSGGLAWTISDDVNVGASVGYLNGDVRQRLERADSSRYNYGSIEDPHWSRHEQGGGAEQHWSYDGGSIYGTAHVRAGIGNGRHVTIHYRLLREDVDLQTRGFVRDTSSSSYAGEYEQWKYTSESYYTLRDTRTGTGTQTGTTHRLGGALQWKLDRRSNLSLGLSLQSDSRVVRTAEPVDAYVEQFYRNEDNDKVYQYHKIQDEAKTLEWDFETEVNSVHIPILFTRSFGDIVSATVGINRRITYWKITDETLAIFQHRLVTENGVTETRENFGERYHEPTERRNDIETSVLGGLKIAPSPSFDIQLLFAPSFSDTFDTAGVEKHQWWIGFTLTP